MMDHLCIFQQLRQRGAEWHQKHWVAAIDCKKAFDTVEYNSVWSALREQDIEEPYIHVLTKLYDKQRATVKTDVNSKQFSLKRCTKQGDPLSTLLFDSPLQHITKPVAEHDRDANFPNLRFADDINLFSGSLKHTTTMLDDLSTATKAHGLQLHPTKNKPSPTRHHKPGKDNTVAAQRMSIDILPPEVKNKYLGQLINFKSAVRDECERCIKCAWVTFTSHRQELTSPKYPLRDRLKLVDATVTPCASGEEGTPDNIPRNDEDDGTDEERIQNRFPS